MTPADIEAMKADALAGTPGDWFVSGMFSVISKTSYYVANAGFGDDSDNGDNIAGANARRVARVPCMESTIVIQAAEIERLTASLLRRRLAGENVAEEMTATYAAADAAAYAARAATYAAADAAAYAAADAAARADLITSLNAA